MRVCVTPLLPKISKLDFNDKCNLQVHFSSKAVVSLYELLYHHSLTTDNPLLEEVLYYLPTRFPSHIFDYINYEKSVNESVRSIDSSISAFYSDDSTSIFSKYFYFFFLFFKQLQNFLPQRRAQDSRKGPPVEKGQISFVLLDHLIIHLLKLYSKIHLQF